jgi:hypothetical protein
MESGCNGSDKEYISKLNKYISELKEYKDAEICKLKQIIDDNCCCFRQEVRKARVIAVAATAVAVIEGVTLAGVAVDGSITLFEEGAGGAVAQARAVRNAAKLLQDTANDVKDILDSTKNIKPKTKLEEQCTGAFSCLASKFSTKVKEKLEDKATELLTETLLKGQETVRPEWQTPRKEVCIDYN